MSTSNPASQAKDNAAAYVKSLMDLLGDRDPFEGQSKLHNERGPESVRKMIRMIAGHDLLHRNQIKRMKRAHAVE